MKKATDYTHTIVDDEGYVWAWNGRRIFCLQAEEEFIEEGIPISQNGYPAKTWDDAVKLLITDGYISDDSYISEQVHPSNNGQEYKDWFDPKESYLPDY
jgi:hypothetical protein